MRFFAIGESGDDCQSGEFGFGIRVNSPIWRVDNFSCSFNWAWIPFPGMILEVTLSNEWSEFFFIFNNAWAMGWLMGVSMA